MKKAVLYITILGIVIGCEKTIDFNGNKSNPILIVNGLINPDSLFQVSVSETKHFTENKEIPVVHNAEVDIYENGNLLETLKHNNEGVYIGSIKPEIGKNYKLKVFGKTNVLDVDAIIPNPVLINNVNFALVIDEYGSGNVEIAVKFNDPPNQENYYRITVFPNPMVYVDDRYPTGFWLSSNDLVIKSLFGGDNALNSSPENGYLIFNDQLINGKDYELKINMVDYEIFAYLSEQETVTRGYTVRLHSISRDYYLYLKSRQLNSYTSDDPFSEPVPIYSNINGGGGIWAAYSISEKNILVDYSR